VRFVEAGEARGSLKWIRRAVNDFPNLLNQRLREDLRLPRETPITWTCPLAKDEFAEYRDDDFIRLCGVKLPQRLLKEFWPVRGPQWDALARVGGCGALLVEAKANIPEIVSPGTGAEGARRALLERSLEEVKSFLGVDPKIPWSGKFYQYANRLAHLYFLREVNQQDAYLAFVYFTGDSDVDGPATIAEWRAALLVAKCALGVPKRHRLSKYVAEVFIDISEMGHAA
jgi:hypothetical protein